ncbi:hypothetical protein BBJ28_00006772 [Nothophytophthora sp. Chile5]|nr:hypothetical protein BBJ28_00006772 [Nothophytophthora sp. Chile5]
MAPPEEVVIDGDSTEEEEEDDEVRIITPQSRKRRRTSAIMMDDEDEGDDQQDEDEETKGGEEHAPPPRQQLLLARDGASPYFKTPTPVRRSQRNLEQLTIAAAVDVGERGRQRQEPEEEDEDDDVRIIQPPSGSSAHSSGRKSRRLMVQDSDDEQDVATRTPRANQMEEEVASSRSRRSSRIERKRQEKAAQQGIARKLDYPVLENCLEVLKSGGPHENEDDDEDEDYEEDEDDFEPKEVTPPPRKRRRPLPREGERDHREKVHADGGEDLDEFIVDDDEVEYMDDDEEGVINVETSDDEAGVDEHEELAAMMAARRSREIHEWFAIYLEYLEECIIDPDLENKMRRSRSKPHYQLYQEAVHHIERQICSRRDSLRVNVAWPEDMVEALKCASQYRSNRVAADTECDACNRRQHVATYHVEFAGVACDATALYSQTWMRRYRTLAYWQLLHAKQFWCILVDAKRKECGDGTGRIAEEHREPFFKKEFGRYKRLTNLVEKFAEDSNRIAVYMPNVWNKVTRRYVTSDFLPLPSRVSSFAEAETEVEPRRGTMDSFVAESDEENVDGEEEDEEAVMQDQEEEKLVIAGVVNDEQQVEGTDEEETKDEEAHHRQTPRSERREKDKEQQHSKPEVATDDQLAADLDADDLKCLVCKKNPRDAAVMHGMYLHAYCCFGCAKHQHQTKSGCRVCKRKIDRVLHLLPLTKETRKAIQRESQQ